MKIFDAHAHLGLDVVFDVAVTEEELEGISAEFGITGALVQPFLPRPYLTDNRQIHDRIFRLTQQYPGTAGIFPGGVQKRNGAGAGILQGGGKGFSSVKSVRQ